MEKLDKVLLTSTLLDVAMCLFAILLDVWEVIEWETTENIIGTGWCVLIFIFIFKGLDCIRKESF